METGTLRLILKFVVTLQQEFCVVWTVLAHFGFHRLLFFAYEVLPCFVYTVIIIKTVVLKTNNWGLKVTDTPAKRRSVICPFLEVFLNCSNLTCYKSTYIHFDHSQPSSVPAHYFSSDQYSSF